MVNKNKTVEQISNSIGIQISEEFETKSYSKETNGGKNITDIKPKQKGKHYASNFNLYKEKKSNN